MVQPFLKIGEERSEENSRDRAVLLVGDLMVYLLVTFFGFVRHDLLG
jgi:hypothetical protein